MQKRIARTSKDIGAEAACDAIFITSERAISSPLRMLYNVAVN